MSQEQYNQLIHSPRGFAYATLRDVILKSILGKETNGILYWIGKDLAREYPVASIDDVITLCDQLGFGNLTLEKSSATQHNFKLSGPAVEERMNINKENTSFSLEAGFIAQEIAFQVNAVTEAETHIHRKSVDIITQNDPANSDEDPEIVNFIKLNPNKSNDHSDKKKK